MPKVEKRLWWNKQDVVSRDRKNFNIFVKVLSHKIFSGEASIWLANIAACAQALSILSSPSAQLAHLLVQAAQVLFQSPSLSRSYELIMRYPLYH